VPVAIAAVLDAADRAARGAGLDPVAFAAQVVMLAYCQRAREALEVWRKAAMAWRTQKGLAVSLRGKFRLFALETSRLEFDKRLQDQAKLEMQRAALARALYVQENRVLAAGMALQRARLAVDEWCELARGAVLAFAGVRDELTQASSPPAGGWDYSHADVERIRREVLEFDAREELARRPAHFAVHEVVKPAHCGPFKVLTRSDGRSVVIDERLPVGARTVDTCASLRAANSSCKAMGEREGFTEKDGAS
jgi:hypothetical protein